MTKARARKLKVFQAQFGFYDTVVAAPSRAAALRAWGIHQNLFDSGDARLVTDGAAVRAALAHPEAPLRRPVGSNAAFALDPNGLPAVPPAPKRAAGSKDKTRVGGEAKAEAPPADRSKLDAAEAALRTLEARREAEEAALRREADALEARRSAAEDAYLAARKTAAAARTAARAAYREAGGTD